MYYLLENNIILSDKQCKKYINYEDRENDYVTYAGKNGDMIIEIYLENGCKEIRTISRVVKKSENVFDLIEVGDLIRYDDEFLGAFPLRQIYLNYGELQLLDGVDIKSLIIMEIYKPNSKGDYIKVWESDL